MSDMFSDIADKGPIVTRRSSRRAANRVEKDIHLDWRYKSQSVMCTFEEADTTKIYQR